MRKQILQKILRFGTSSFNSTEKSHLTRSISIGTSRWIQKINRNRDLMIDPTPSLVGFNNYEEAVRNFSLPVPEYYNFGRDVIDYWAKQEQVSDVRKGLPAFWWVNEDGHEIKWTFTELAEHSKRVANILTGPCGLKPGDRIMIILPRIPQWWLLNIAAIRAGIILISGTTQLTPKDIKYRFERSNSKCIVTDTANADKVDQVVGDVDCIKTKVVVGGNRTGWVSFEDLFFTSSSDFETVKTRSNDPMMIFFTSGTTGQPKMAEHSHSSYGLGHKITATYGMDFVPTDINWTIADTGWAKTAWGNIFSPWINGACIFIHTLQQFDTQQVLKLLEKYPITTFCAPPTGFRFLVNDKVRNYNLKTLRHYFSGGEPVNASVVEQWYDATGFVIHELYGQTELVLTCMSPKYLPFKRGSMGIAAPGMDVAIVDENGQKVGPNVVGEIAVRVKPNKPVGLFLGYVDEPEKTASCFKGDYYLTGDRGTVDDEGYFYFVSRKDDLINSAGYRIGPYEVETALLHHPAVIESAVISSPDEKRGEVVKAFVVLKPEFIDTDKGKLTVELQNHVKETTAPYKYPRKIEFVDSLPKTISGKIRRAELRANEWKTQVTTQTSAIHA